MPATVLEPEDTFPNTEVSQVPAATTMSSDPKPGDVMTNPELIRLQESRKFLEKMKNFRTSTTNLEEGLDYVSDMLGKAFYGNDEFLSSFVDATPEEIDDEVLQRLSDLATSLSTRTTSVAFAGIAAHDVSDRMLAAFLGQVLQRQVTPPKSMWLIEKDNACQAELGILHSAEMNPAVYQDVSDQPCIFSDIMQFWRPELKELIDQLTKSPQLAMESLSGLILQRRAVKLSAECKTHGKICKLRPAHRHSAGSVCTPYSSQGLQQGLADVSVLCLLVWML